MINKINIFAINIKYKIMNINYYYIFFLKFYNKLYLYQIIYCLQLFLKHYYYLTNTFFKFKSYFEMIILSFIMTKNFGLSFIFYYFKYFKMIANY